MSGLGDAAVRHGRRRWLWRAVALIGLAGTVAAVAWLAPTVFRLVTNYARQPLTEQSARAGVASMLIGAAGLLVSIAALILGLLQLRQASGSGRPVPPEIRRQQQAVDRLRAHLGRQDRLRRMGDPAVQALALRVHPAIDLPTPAADAASTVAIPQMARWRRLLSRRWTRHAQPMVRLDRDLPTFVDRDKGPDVRAWMCAARQHGGFLVLVGDSSVGKTRLLYEAAREVLDDFALLAPDFGDGELVNQLAAATFPLPRLLVWLDELQRFLEGPYLTPGSTAITAATVRRLLDAPTAVVIVGTLWPDYATQLRASDHDPGTGQPRPRYPNAVDILDDRRVHELALQTFSEAERQAAAHLAASDPRLATAVADRDYNVTEVLAGARELVRRYERGTREQQAVVQAAVDARRLGIQAPLGDRLLCAAARGYLEGVYADDSWFGPVLAELTSDRRPHDHATAPLIPVSDRNRSRVLGYTVADYLLQRLTRQRRAARVPGATWQALIDHTSQNDDLARLADSAKNRLLYGVATAIYRRLADAGDRDAAWELATLLEQQGEVEELRARAEAGDKDATDRLNERLAKQGKEDELRARADAGDESAAAWLAVVLSNLPAEQGRMDELRARAKAGDQEAAYVLADFLAQQGHLDELCAHADAGDEHAAYLLAKLLAEQGRRDELRARAGAGDKYATHLLVNLLAEQGHVDEAIRLVRDHAHSDKEAARQLILLLARQGGVDVVRARADAGDESAAVPLALMLVEHGLVDELRERADAGDDAAAYVLADLLAKQGQVDELRARADATAAADMQLAAVLAEQGQVDELRVRADAGSNFADMELTRLLAKQGSIEELQVEVDAGRPTAGNQLIGLLEQRGRIEQAARLRRFGFSPDGSAAEALDSDFEHSDTITARYDVARRAAETGDAGEALRQFRKVLIISERILGPDHPNTLTARHQVAYWTGQTGDAREALRQSREILAANGMHFGSDHPSTLAARYWVAYWTGQTGDAGEALRQFREVLAASERVNGPDHPSTLAARHEVACWTGETGDAGEALRQFRDVLAARERALGPNHPDTLATHNAVQHLEQLPRDA